MVSLDADFYRASGDVIFGCVSQANFEITPSNDHINGVVDNIHQAKD
jgi:hypothetical protein